MARVSGPDRCPAQERSKTLKQDLKLNLHYLLESFDVWAVFALAVLPDLVSSMMQATTTQAASSSFNSLLLLLIVRSLQVSLPILLILKLRKIRWADFGFVKLSLLRDLATGLGLAFLGYLAYYLLAYGLLLAGVDFSDDADALQSMTQDSRVGIGTIALLILCSCANGFAEEIAMRSYLLVRIGELSGSMVVGAALTTVLFAAYHSYQGRYGIVSAFAVGAVFATYFVVTKRFWPIAIAHALMDLGGFAALLVSEAG